MGIVEEGTKTAIPSLVPVLLGRMRASPFIFYRGIAALIVADLRRSPVSGINTQFCEDGHFSSCGKRIAPDRSFVFAINDFNDELGVPCN
ncbi:MAG: DUF2252 domain-containing protein [Ilumatobacter sp.]|nr:DUF2252 domain-containing protein [Ilumatobacter sp.]